MEIEATKVAGSVTDKQSKVCCLPSHENKIQYLNWSNKYINTKRVSLFGHQKINHLSLLIKMSSLKLLSAPLRHRSDPYLNSCKARGSVVVSLTQSGVHVPGSWALCSPSSGACHSGPGVSPPASGPALSARRWPRSPRREGRTLISTEGRRSYCALSLSQELFRHKDINSPTIQTFSSEAFYKSCHFRALSLNRQFTQIIKTASVMKARFKY